MVTKHIQALKDNIDQFDNLIDNTNKLFEWFHVNEWFEWLHVNVTKNHVFNENATKVSNDLG